MRKAVAAEADARGRKKSRAEAIHAAFDRFYKGDIAQEFDRFFKENHGLLTAADLAAYARAWRNPRMEPTAAMTSTATRRPRAAASNC